jgi:hypothetical protein
VPIRREIHSRDNHWYNLQLRPYRTVDGKIDGVVITFVDITQQKDLEEHQRLLLGELTHRVKNTLAAVQAIAHQTVRKKQSNQDFIQSFDARLAAIVCGQLGQIPHAAFCRSAAYEFVRCKTKLTGHDGRLGNNRQIGRGRNTGSKLHAE